MSIKLHTNNAPNQGAFWLKNDLMKISLFCLSFLCLVQCYAQSCGIDFDRSTGITFYDKIKPLKSGFSEKNTEFLTKAKKCLNEDKLAGKEKSMLCNKIAATYYYHTHKLDSVIKYINVGLKYDRDWFLEHIVLVEHIWAGDQEFYEDQFHPYYLTNMDIISKTPLLSSYDKSIYIENIIKQGINRQKKNEEPSNIDYVTELEIIFNQDQRFRAKEVLQEQKHLDINNRNRLDSLYQLYGFPSALLIGHKNTITPWLVLQHSTDCEWNKKWIKRYLDAYQTGEFKQGLLMYTFERFYRPQKGYCSKENEESVNEFIQELKANYPAEYGEIFGYEKYGSTAR